MYTKITQYEKLSLVKVSSFFKIRHRYSFRNETKIYISNNYFKKILIAVVFYILDQLSLRNLEELLITIKNLN